LEAVKPAERLQDLLQLIERAQRERQIVDGLLLEAVREIERDAWQLRHKIEDALRPVREYLHHQPIGDVVEVLAALNAAEALILTLPHVATGDAAVRGLGRRRRRSAAERI
jgi:ElaB/YqjD/DUF883 family membrane-anchored ribosome-binding protein